MKVKLDDMMALVEETLSQRQQAIFKVTGVSMMPFFHDQKTNVTLEKKETYQKGDVVLFRYQGGYRLHRIIKIKGEKVVATGDNLRSEESFEMKDIVGVVVSFEHQGKHVSCRKFIYRFQVRLWRIIRPVVFFWRMIR